MIGFDEAIARQFTPEGGYEQIGKEHEIRGIPSAATSIKEQRVS
jgi:hypothetical protein